VGGDQLLDGADELGEVRDLDVLLKRLRKDARVLDPADQPPAEQVLEALRGERANAYRRLRASLRSPRCADLLEFVTRSATAPAISSKRARRSAADVVPGLVGGPLADLRRAAKRMGKAPDDAALHRVRIHVKRLRYATELAAPLAGGQARGAARSLARLQDVLGDHNDACVAVVRLRAVSEHSPAAAAWAAGAMGGLQVARARTCRERFPAVWSDAVRAKRWRWVP
jgi:CHAD domain-containing protein